MDKAKEVLPDVISAIDMAAKKKILHENNAAHKKSRVQKAINTGTQKKEVQPVKEKASKKEEKVAKKVEEVTEEVKKDE